MNLRKFIACSAVLFAVSPLCGCSKSDATKSLETSVTACLAKEGMADVGLDVPFVGEKPLVTENGGRPGNWYFRDYDMERRTVTKRGGSNQNSLGTLTYDQLPEPERKKMDIIEKCLNVAGSSPESGPK